MATAPTTPVPTPVPARITAATVAVAQAAGARNTARLKVDTLTAERAELAARIAVLVEVLKPVTRAAWCADFTEDATGEVATVEIPGEDKLLLMAPGAPRPVAADGVLIAREAQSPEQVFWNAAVLPGWQKFKPTYRRGTITALNTTTETASVTISSDVSSAQNLGINPTPNLTNVPVQYMTCNAGAFEVGDKVVLKFTGGEWLQPKVVGFAEGPKPCPYGTHLIFWTPGTSLFGGPNVIDTSAGTAPTNYELTVAGRYYFVSVNTPLCTAAKLSAQEIGDISLQITETEDGSYGTRTVDIVSYTVLGFFMGKPILRRYTEASNSSWSNAFTSNGTNYKQSSITWGAQVVAEGTVSSTGSMGGGVSTSVQTFSNFPAFAFAKWNAVVGMVQNGSKTATITEIETPPYGQIAVRTEENRTLLWAPLIDRPNGAKQAQLPAYDLQQNPDVTVPVPSPGYPSGPGVNRHQLDFFWRRTYYGTSRVRACCKNTFYTYGNRPGTDSLRITRYDLNPALEQYLFLPEIDATGTSEPWKHNCFFNDHIVSVQSYPDGADFKLTLYWLDGRAPLKMSNRPGASGVDSDGFTRITVPGLPAGARLVGAMRDEITCM